MKEKRLTKIWKTWESLNFMMQYALAQKLRLDMVVPLDAHPELSKSIPAPGAVEFKVENWRLRKGSTRVPREGPGLSDLVFGVFSAWAWYKLDPRKSFQNLCLWMSIGSLYLYFKCTQLLYECIIILPLHGIQLETYRGVKFPFVQALPLATRRRFIPLNSIRDVVINEGLRRWNVRYYLCIIRDTGSKVTLDVAFENVLPRFPVLEFVYNEIQTLLRRSRGSPTITSEITDSATPL